MWDEVVADEIILIIVLRIHYNKDPERSVGVIPKIYYPSRKFLVNAKV